MAALLAGTTIMFGTGCSWRTASGARVSFMEPETVYYAPAPVQYVPENVIYETPPPGVVLLPTRNFGISMWLDRHNVRHYYQHRRR